MVKHFSHLIRDINLSRYLWLYREKQVLICISPSSFILAIAELDSYLRHVVPKLGLESESSQEQASLLVAV